MTRTTAAVCLVLCSSSGAFAQCRPPRYRLGSVYLDSSSDWVASISMRPQDFAPGKLVCLASTFKGQYSDRGRIMVNIFSSSQAAQGPILMQEYTGEDMARFAQMHAQYVFDADRREDYVEILPAGSDIPSPLPGVGPYGTRIDLPAGAAIHCRLELGSRCLIALDDVTYPPEALKRRVGGKVTLAAAVTRGGCIRHIQVVKTEATPRDGENLLANAAVRNLSTWRAEPGSRQEALQITYSYVIDDSLPESGLPRVQWALPTDVMVTDRPPK